MPEKPAAISGLRARQNEYDNMSRLKELKKLNTRTRNQLRALLYADVENGVDILNKLREKCTAKELMQVENVIRSGGVGVKAMMPDIFPVEPQTEENYHRLVDIGIGKQIEILGKMSKDKMSRLEMFCQNLELLNRAILNKNISRADELVQEIFDDVGYSHFLLRKSALVYSLLPEGESGSCSEGILHKSGLGDNNVIVNSVVQCYQEEQDFLGMKRSIMNIPDRGVANKFTRDIARIPFHPFASDQKQLSSLLQSGLQSSLIDALIFMKVNSHLVHDELVESIKYFFQLLDAQNKNIDEIVKIYPQESEYLFYKQSSAWLEDVDVVRYRFLIDHFFDDPEAGYFELKDEMLKRLSEWVADVGFNELASGARLTMHSYPSLAKIESEGLVTKSAVFNFILHGCQGEALVGEQDIIEIMGSTRDLVRTIDVKFAKILAINQQSKLSKIILYLLIAKKSKNEADSHALRKLIQEVVKKENKGSLVDFVSALSERSKAVAEYTYQVCTEDFIAKLSHIIGSSSDITETRAALHKWMGDFTGEKAYKVRGRTLLIDHQINKIRNEIDDNRIYVDVARFSEWINDEVIHELGIVLASMDHTNSLESGDNTQIIQIIEKCYFSFCGNNIFGIASYLGRRIRHGTFKGHLYSGVISIEESYKDVLEDPLIKTKWDNWKSLFESSVDDIIRKRLHVESQSKRDGLLKPTIKTSGKFEVADACAVALSKDYLDNRSTGNSDQILTEYCWRLAEVDLKNTNAFLKNQKSRLVNIDFLNDIKNSEVSGSSDRVKDFARDVQRGVTDKLQAIYGWFKRPISASPKASLSLLYKAVVAEVQDTFSGFDADTDFDEETDIELVGGPYHVLYDAFYVVIYNAAKHGKAGGLTERVFKLVRNEAGRCVAVRVVIKSEIKEEDTEEGVSYKLEIDPNDDIDNAQLSEERSGIKKLYHLQKSDKNFRVDKIKCSDRKVIVELSYALEH